MKTLPIRCGFTGCTSPVIGSCDYCGIPLCETHARTLKQSAQSEIYCGGCLIYLQTSGMDERPIDRKVIPNLLVINSKKCTGCRSCELACSFEHYKEFSYELSAIKVLKFEEKARSYPLLCFHCENPPCVDACPTNALVKQDENGMVVLNEDDCNLCERCVGACPFGVILFNPRRKKIIKCDLCAGDPACAKVCAPEAIEWVKKFRFGERRKIVLDLNPYSRKEN